MFLRSLFVSKFRNIQTCNLEFKSKVAVFVGGNGQGKTSLLEAIYLFSHTKSFRTSRATELISRLYDGTTKVEGLIESNDGAKTLCYLYDNAKRSVFINNNRVTAASEFYGTAKVIDFTPDDLFLVKGSPAERRRFIDKLLSIVDKEYLNALVRYQRALKNRNALLNSHKASRAIEYELSLWDIPLIENGEVISLKRKELISELNLNASRIYSKLSNKAELIECIYKSHFIDGVDKKTEYKKRLDRDIRLKSTSFGIHRDDLLINLNSGFGMTLAKEISSQGQTRSVALSLKLAAIEFLKKASLGEDPIVLLDDVESELDEKRLSFLLNYLLAIDSQIFIATTKREILQRMEKVAQFFSVESGKIVPL